MRNRDLVNLRDIAENVGVSRMTVSAALRGDGRVAPATRKKILEEAQRLGYVPNERLSKVMTEVSRSQHRKESGKLVLLTTEDTEDGWEQFSPKLWQGLVSRAKTFGYEMEPFWVTNPRLSPERLNQILWTRGVQGVVIPHLSHRVFISGRRTLPLDWTKFCAVEIGDTITQPVLNRVRHSHYEGMTKALEELESIGYKKIGLCLTCEDDLRTHHRWCAAYFLWHAMRRQPTSLKPLLVEVVKAGEVVRWVRKNRLEAVLGVGGAVLNALQAHFEVPGEVGFASLDLWGPEAKSATGIDQEYEEVVSTTAVDMLVNLIFRRERGIPEHPAQWVFSGKWKNGETTRVAESSPALRRLSEEPLRL